MRLVGCRVALISETVWIGVPEARELAVRRPDGSTYHALPAGTEGKVDIATDTYGRVVSGAVCFQPDARAWRAQSGWWYGVTGKPETFLRQLAPRPVEIPDAYKELIEGEYDDDATLDGGEDTF